MAQRSSVGSTVIARSSISTIARRVRTARRRDTGSESRYSRPAGFSKPVPASAMAKTGQNSSMAVLNHRSQT